MTATVFLVQTVFGFYILAVMLRFLLQCVRADFYNPMVQFVVRITNPLLLPLRRVVPGYRGLDLAAVVLMIGLQALLVLLIAVLMQRPWGLGSMIFATVFELMGLLLNVYLWAIILQALLSWFNPDPYHPIGRVLNTLTDPLLRPIQRLLPPISGIDLSPLVAVVGLTFLRLLLEDLIRAIWGGA